MAAASLKVIHRETGEILELRAYRAYQKRVVRRNRSNYKQPSRAYSSLTAFERSLARFINCAIKVVAS